MIFIILFLLLMLFYINNNNNNNNNSNDNNYNKSVSVLQDSCFSGGFPCVIHQRIYCSCSTLEVPGPFAWT